jgi:hypothetical protein
MSLDQAPGTEPEALRQYNLLHCPVPSLLRKLLGRFPVAGLPDI